MHSRTHNLMLLALFAFSMRALVPVGLMPAAVADGWFLQLCPQGMTAAAMAVLAGDGHHHHHQHHAEQEQSATPTQCDLSGGVSATLEVANLDLALPELLQAAGIARPKRARPTHHWPLSSYPRAPPSPFT